MDTSKRLPLDKEGAFPNLFPSGYGVTSKDEYWYNCIAWAAEDQNECWDPFCTGNGYFWPDGLERNTEVETFVKLYGITRAYVKCDSPDPELGFEKIALYVGSDGEITHAARQMPDGTWTSKLGEWEDIGHKTINAFVWQYLWKSSLFFEAPVVKSVEAIWTNFKTREEV